jgi:hypothetical protein
VPPRCGPALLEELTGAIQAWYGGALEGRPQPA